MDITQHVVGTQLELIERNLIQADVPDAIWPTDNEYDIPLLNASLQAKAVYAPVMLWGAVKRSTRVRGTWCFYTDDYRFEALWKNPATVVNTDCAAVVEPNFTIGPQMPRAVALWNIYRKRWLARWWQSYGIEIFVDVNIDVEYFSDIMLLGVPQGWKSYATRGYTEELDAMLQGFEFVCQHAQSDDVLFLVYGGGRIVKALARQYGWVWVPEHMSCKRNGVVLDMSKVWG